MSDLRRIDAIARIRRGASPRPIGDSRYFGGDVGWVRIVDVTRSSRFLRETEQYLSPLGESLSVRVKPGDLVMSICGTIGRPIVVDMEACIHDGFVQFFDIRGADARFLYYALQHAEPAFRAMGQPGTQTNLNTSLVGRHAIFCPVESEQRRIAEILSTLDETIEQTEALIAKYQQIKAGLMHDLFTRGVTPDGRLRPTRTQAPHLYKESPLGSIPKEWAEKRLGECFTLQRGFDITQEQQSSGDVPVVSSSGITSFHSVAMCPGPGVVIGRKGKLGNAYYLKIKYWPHDTTLWVKDFHGNSVPFARYFLIWMRLDRFDAATSVPTLNRNFIHPLRVALPSPAEQERIVLRLDAHEILIESAESELAKYRMLKLGLMHDLLTGRVRVRATESEEVPA